VLEEAEDMVRRETTARALLWKGKSMQDVAREFGVG